VLATENIRKEYKQRAKAIRNRGLTNILPKVQLIEKINYRTVTDMDTIIEFFLPLFSGERTVALLILKHHRQKNTDKKKKQHWILINPTSVVFLSVTPQVTPSIYQWHI